jgi:hypothetical protein
VPEGPAPELKLLIEEVQARSARAKTEFQAAEKVRKLVEAVAEAWPTRPALAAALLSKESDALEALPADDQVRRDLRELWTAAQTAAKAAASDLVRVIPQGLESKGLHIDSESRHPRYSVASHLVELEIQTDKMVGLIRPRHGDVIKEPLDPAAVIERVAAEHARLVERPFDAAAFHKGIEAAIRKSGKAGDAVPVRKIAQAMVTSGKPKLDEFAVDLGRLLSHDEYENQPTLKVNHTRDVDRGLLLFGLEQGGYVGSMEIRGGSE